MDMRNFVLSCDECQRMSQKRLKPAPLTKILVFSEPFASVSIDIVSPLLPSSTAGHKFI